MAEVEYRTALGFTGYRVGDDGSVWSLWKQKSLGIGKGSQTFLSDTWRQLCPTARRSCGGHQVVSLCRDGETHLKRVHHLVLEAFVGPRPAGMEGCHFPDPDPTNNRVRNLRWDTPKGNQSDRVAHGTTNRGQRNGRAVLSEAKVKEIRGRCVDGKMSNADVVATASEFGISPSAIRDVVAGRKWRCVE